MADVRHSKLQGLLKFALNRLELSQKHLLRRHAALAPLGFILNFKYIIFMKN
jgi:hypothetical protein